MIWLVKHLRYRTEGARDLRAPDEHDEQRADHRAAVLPARARNRTLSALWRVPRHPAKHVGADLRLPVQDPSLPVTLPLPPPPPAPRPGNTDRAGAPVATDAPAPYAALNRSKSAAQCGAFTKTGRGDARCQNEHPRKGPVGQSARLIQPFLRFSRGDVTRPIVQSAAIATKIYSMGLSPVSGTVEPGSPASRTKSLATADSACNAPCACGVTAHLY